jgi:hypothetical protein
MYRWDVPLWNASLGQRLQRLLALSSNTLQQQQEQWGVPASRQFQMLWRCACVMEFGCVIALMHGSCVWSQRSQYVLLLAYKAK